MKTVLRGLLTVFCIFLSTLGAAALAGVEKPTVLSGGWLLEDAAKVSQDGPAISSASFQPAGWHRATVPGTVLTSLVNDAIYPEPLYGLNNLTIPDSLCRTAWWYRTTFATPPTAQGRRTWLKFEGVNYIADVWLNGQELGTIKGAFIRGIFDVTTNLAADGVNALAVRIEPEPHPGDTHQKTIANGTGRNGGVTGMDGPTFLCTIGWDWIPTIRDRDSGIWQDVTLSQTGPVILENPVVNSDLPLPKLTPAELTVQATLRNVTDTPQNGALTGKADGIHFARDILLQPNETKTITLTSAEVPSLRLKNPRLWWPNGLGPANLYTLHLDFSIDGALSDERDVTFGVRKITYFLPGSDNLALSVNGVPVMIKGGDWGIDEAMKRIPRARLEAQIRMHQLANYNMIRNWVGQSTSEDLYELCDKYGILLWDEFFEPHPLDGPIPQNVEIYLANVRDKILRFRSHPCIALWCARNEGDPPPEIGANIQKLLAILDPARLYQPSSTSGRGVNSGGPYHWRTPREFYSWTEAFKTEIGSISVPTIEAIHGMMPSNDWNEINDDWAEHDFCAGAQQGDQYAQMIASRYGYPMDLADFTRKAQLANYECFRAMYEGRFAQMFHPSTGVITWMSHPAQPSFVWQLYSYDLEPNASLYGARKACEPVHIMLNQSNWHVMVVNNKASALRGGKAKVSIYNLDGSAKFQHEYAVTAQPTAVADLGELEFPADLSDAHFVKLELFDSKGRSISDNFYWRELPGRRDDLQALNSLPTVTLEVQATRRDAAGKSIIDAIVANPAKSIALMTHLQLRRQPSMERVLPVFYSDNYFSLLPGESKKVRIEAASSDLGQGTAVLSVDGWNVTVKPNAGPSVEVRANFHARPSLAKPAATLVESLGINCGGGPVGFFRFGEPSLGIFARDFGLKGGNVSETNVMIDTNVPNAAPMEIYQSERWGACSYTVPVKMGSTYTIRLHFAETKFDPGQRRFNVDINAKQVLSDFDIAAEGGKNKAVVKDIPSVSPDAEGRIVVAFTRGSADQPKICGIQILKE